MDKVEEKIVERQLREVIKQIQRDYHCSFSEAVGIAKKWIHEYSEQKGVSHECN